MISLLGHTFKNNNSHKGTQYVFTIKQSNKRIIYSSYKEY